METLGSLCASGFSFPRIARASSAIRGKEKADHPSAVGFPSAERGGFEPPVPVDPVRQFSKLLVSATHPPLRGYSRTFPDEPGGKYRCTSDTLEPYANNVMHPRHDPPWTYTAYPTTGHALTVRCPLHSFRTDRSYPGTHCGLLLRPAIRLHHVASLTVPRCAPPPIPWTQTGWKAW